MSLHKEIAFESEICSHLGAHGWLHAARFRPAIAINEEIL